MLSSIGLARTSRRVTRRRVTRRAVVAAGNVAALVALAACSSSGSGGAAPGATGSSVSSSIGSTNAAASCLGAANDFLKPYDTLPTSLPAALTPLAQTPMKGGSIVDVVGPVPSEQTIADAEKEAAGKLGWTAQSVHDDGSVEDVNAKLEQAIAMHPTIITVSGYPVAALTEPLEAAKKAGIVVVMGAQTDTPTGYPGFAAATGGKSAYETMGRIDAFEFMRASNCTGSVDIMSLGNYPVVAAGDSSFKATVSQYCPACEITSTSIQAKDIGTAAATGAVVSSLQANPGVSYIRVDIGSMATGLSAAMAQVGRKVTIFGDVPDAAAIAALRNKTNAWWVNFGSGLFAYALFDAGLRATESKGPVTDNGSFPLAVLSPGNVPAGTLPTVPSNYPDLFAKLWGV